MRSSTLPSRLFGSALLVVAAASGPTHAAEEAAPILRAEEWRRLREAKRSQLRPYRAGFLERNMLAIEKAERPSILDFNLGGVYPRVQNIASGSETAFGVRLWRPDLGTSAWDVHGSAFHSVRGYEFYDLQVGRLPHRGKRFPARSTKGDDLYELGDVPGSGDRQPILYASARYRHYPQTVFYGLGPGSRREDVTGFLLQDALYEVVAGYQLGRHVAATLRGGLLQAFVGPGTEEGRVQTAQRFGDGQAPGLLSQPDFLVLASSLLLDYRDEPGNPHRGGMLGLSFAHHDDREGNAFRFRRFAADARGFVPLGSRQRTLAVRAYGSFDTAASGARVPFYLQETLGGSHTLRGFPSFRFRGEKLLLLQAEYRWEAAAALELALFADAGTVSGPGRDLDLDEWEGDVGAGLRLKTHEVVLFRLDVARGSEGARVLLRVSPSF